MDEEALFCKIVVDNKLLTQRQIDRMRAERDADPENTRPLVILAIERGLIDDHMLEQVLELQREYLEDATDGGRALLFGEVAVARGFCTPDVLEAGIKEQKSRDRKVRLGQILVDLGHLQPGHIPEILKVQGKRIGRCVSCQSKFNINNWNDEKAYSCPRCDGQLLPYAESATSMAVEVERESLVSSLISSHDQPGDLTGETIAGYQIVELIGQGGMAEVYKAYNPTDRRTRALKIVKPDSPQARFMREIESAKKLRHPAIIRLYDSGFHRKRAYYFMELIRGDTLMEWMRRVPIAFDDGLELVRQVTAGLAHAHEMLVTHRDVKPSNILVDRSGGELRAKLTDFGIAKAANDTGLTGTGQIVGTMKYLSPEQIRGDDLDGRSDIFSLGIMCHEVFTGREPFDVDSKVGYLFVNIKETAPRLSSRKSSIPPALDQMVARMLERDVERRYTADVLLEDLTLLQAHLATGAILRSENRHSVFFMSSSRRIFSTFKDLLSFSGRTRAISAESAALPAQSAAHARQMTGPMARQTRKKRPRSKKKAPAATDARAELAYARRLIEGNDLSAARRCLENLREKLPPGDPARVEATELLMEVEHRDLASELGSTPARQSLGGGHDSLNTEEDTSASMLGGDASDMTLPPVDEDLTEALLVDRELVAKIGADQLTMAQEGLVIVKTFVENLRTLDEYDRGIGGVLMALRGIDDRQLDGDGTDELAELLYRLAGFLQRRKRKDDAQRRMWDLVKLFPDSKPAQQALADLVRMEPADGMIYLPPGPMRFEDGTELEQAPDRLLPFFIDKTPITNLQYKTFIDETDYPSPARWDGDTYPIGRAAHPVTGVNYFDAKAYADWAGKRLPTEFEWARAARGAEPCPYPWGENFELARANTRASGIGDTTPVDAYPDGQSPEGCLDMCGNVWEWTESWYTDRGGEGRRRVLRGGSWFSYPEFATTAYRNFELPKSRRRHFGFRCARSLVREENGA